MSNDTPNPIPTPAGWYPDTAHPPLERYWDGTAWTAQTRYPAPEGPGVGAAPAKPKRRWHWWVIGIVGALIVIAALGSSGETETPTAEDPAAVASTATSDAAKPKPKAKAEPPKPKYTAAQENAIRSAKDYLDFKGYSRAGLIDQLTSEYADGYKKADAVFAVNHIKVDWNAEAVEAAEDYLDYKGFSRAGLIEQLTSPYADKFTREQAEYAATEVGLL